MDHEKRTLPNGVRVLVAEMPEARSASITVFVGAGSRMESRVDAGTGHFLEHIVFKGTAKRPTAAEISQVIESKGGVVNAATDKEVTVFWSRVPARHWKVALDVVADLIRAPMLRPGDIDNEKHVVIEELRMYRDQPQDRVHTMIDELLYPKHPLGWEVAGREPVIKSLTADDIRCQMRLRDHFADGAMHQQMTIGDVRDLVTALRLVHIVRGDEDREPIGRERMDLVPEFAPRLRVDAGGRLIEQK